MTNPTTTRSPDAAPTATARDIPMKRATNCTVTPQIRHSALTASAMVTLTITVARRTTITATITETITTITATIPATITTITATTTLHPRQERNPMSTDKHR